MKKVLFAIAVAVVAFVACEKTPDPEKGGEHLTYTGPKEVIIEEGTNFYTVNFKAGTEWSAFLEENFQGVKSGAEELPVTMDKSEGGAGDQSIKLTFNDLEEDEDGRLLALTVTAGTEEFSIVFMQGKVFVVRSMGEGNILGPDGGEVTYKIYTSCDYDLKTYQGEDQAFPWAPVTFDKEGGFLTFTVGKNTTYDTRSAYVKFTIDEIQIPAEEGGTTAYVERAYVYQGGSMKEAWRTDFTWDLHAENSSYTIAMADGKMYLSTGEGVFTIDPKTGAIGNKLELAVTPKGITNDSVGNVIFYTGGDFPLNEGDPYEHLKVYVLDKANLTDLSKAKLIVDYEDGFYGYGLDNVRVTGDATKDALVDCFSAAGWAGGSNIVSFEIKNGASTEESTDFVSLPWTSAIWSSRNMVGMHLGTTVDSGVLTIGYDGNYNLHYNDSMTAANFKEVLTTGSSWAEGYNAIDIIDWNGHKYASFIGMSYFGKTNWGDESADWDYMPSYLWLLNIDNPEAPVVVSTSEYYMTEDLFVYGDTTDIRLVIEGSDLCAYLVDAGVSVIRKVVFPALD